MSTSPQQSPPTSPRRTPAPRGSSHHVPITPSRLRRSVAAASDQSPLQHQDEDQLTPLSSPVLPSLAISAEPEPIANPNNQSIRGGIVESSSREADARTRLLENYHRGSVCGARDCNHGTFSPHVRAQGSTSSNVSTIDGFGGRNGDDINNEDGEVRDTTRGLIGDLFADGLFGSARRPASMSTTKWLATKHGVRNQRTM
jgi:hypothetical protein